MVVCYTVCMYEEECYYIHIFHPSQNSRRINDLTIKPDTLDLTAEQVGDRLESLSTEDDILSRIRIVQALRLTHNIGAFRKLENFCKSKNTINETNWQPTERKIILLSVILLSTTRAIAG